MDAGTVAIALLDERGRVDEVVSADWPSRIDDLCFVSGERTPAGSSPRSVALTAWIGGEEHELVQLDQLGAELERSGIHVSRAWTVQGGRYRFVGCRDAFCCPPQGTPLPPLLPRGIPEGSGTQCDALAAFRSAVRQSLDGRQPSEDDLWNVINGLADVHARDAIIVEVGGGGAELADIVAAGGDADGVREVIASLFDTRSPDHAEGRWSAIQAVTRSLIAQFEYSEDEHEMVPVLALAALVHWWSGELDEARFAVHRASAVDPNYSLVKLMYQALRHVAGSGAT